MDHPRNCDCGAWYQHSQSTECTQGPSADEWFRAGCGRVVHYGSGEKLSDTGCGDVEGKNCVADPTPEPSDSFMVDLLADTGKKLAAANAEVARLKNILTTRSAPEGTNQQRGIVALAEMNRLYEEEPERDLDQSEIVKENALRDIANTPDRCLSEADAKRLAEYDATGAQAEDAHNKCYADSQEYQTAICQAMLQLRVTYKKKSTGESAIREDAADKGEPDPSGTESVADSPRDAAVDDGKSDPASVSNSPVPSMPKTGDEIRRRSDGATGTVAYVEPAREAVVWVGDAGIRLPFFHRDFALLKDEK